MLPLCRLACSSGQPPVAAVARNMPCCPCCASCCARLMPSMNWCSAKRAREGLQRQQQHLQPPLLLLHVHIGLFCTASKEVAGCPASSTAGGCSRLPPPPGPLFSPHPHSLDALIYVMRPLAAPALAAGALAVATCGHGLAASRALPPAARGHSSALGDRMLHDCGCGEPCLPPADPLTGNALFLGTSVSISWQCPYICPCA